MGGSYVGKIVVLVQPARFSWHFLTESGSTNASCLQPAFLIPCLSP